jgi:uncharacterized protein (DUF1330 family)
VSTIVDTSPLHEASECTGGGASSAWPSRTPTIDGRARPAKTQPLRSTSTDASWTSKSGKVLPFLEQVGAAVLYAGECSTVLVAPEGHEWDAIFVVRYPSRAAFLSMAGDADYQAITELRTNGLEAAVL